MQDTTITRLRNAFALVATELVSDAPSSALTAGQALPFSSMTESDWRAAVRLWRQHSAELLASLPARPQEAH